MYKVFFVLLLLCREIKVKLNIDSRTLKDFKNAKNENYYFLNPEHFKSSFNKLTQL